MFLFCYASCRYVYVSLCSVLLCFYFVMFLFCDVSVLLFGICCEDWWLRRCWKIDCCVGVGMLVLVWIFATTPKGIKNIAQSANILGKLIPTEV